MTAWRLKTIADLPNTPGSSKDDGLHFELMAGLSAEGAVSWGSSIRTPERTTHGIWRSWWTSDWRK